MRLLPSTLAGQFLVVIIGAVFLAQSFVFVLLLLETSDKLEDITYNFVNDPIIRVYEQTAGESQSLRERFFETSSNLDMMFSVTDTPKGISPELAGSEEFQKFAEYLDAPVLIDEDYASFSDVLHFWMSDDEDNCFIQTDGATSDYTCPLWTVSVQYPDGLWMTASGHPGPDALFILAPVFVSGLMTLIGITIVVALLTRRLTAPLRSLSAAAEDIGHGRTIDALPVTGPTELASVMAAFNEMQERVNRFVQDRTTMLAAISHDLRTPITSLRLRAEFVEDDELRQKIVESLDDMQTMVESFLTFARQEVSNEQQQEFDLVPMCRRMAEEHPAVTFNSDIAQCLIVGQKVGLQRALSNVVGNAIKFGKKADIGLSTINDIVLITVDDKGPGVPEKMLEEIFAPFVRLDDARSVVEGSVGLGLSIARSIIRKHGGDIRPVNTSDGLQMRIQLSVVGSQQQESGKP